jgi:hypothetical protein
MTKLINRHARLFLLASIVFAMVGAFTFSNRTVRGEEGGVWTCKEPTGCGNFGCYRNNAGVMVCTLYNLQGSTHCSGTVNCDPPPQIE